MRTASVRIVRLLMTSSCSCMTAGARQRAECAARCEAPLPAARQACRCAPAGRAACRRSAAPAARCASARSPPARAVLAVPPGSSAWVLSPAAWQAGYADLPSQAPCAGPPIQHIGMQSPLVGMQSPRNADAFPACGALCRGAARRAARRPGTPPPSPSRLPPSPGTAEGGSRAPRLLALAHMVVQHRAGHHVAQLLRARRASKCKYSRALCPQCCATGGHMVRLGSVPCSWVRSPRWGGRDREVQGHNALTLPIQVH